MAKFFAVELSVTAIVQVGDDETQFDAAKVARYHRKSIMSECGDPDAEVAAEVTQQGQLSIYGWDGYCLPYGGDGNTRLADLLPPESGSRTQRQEGGE